MLDRSTRLLFRDELIGFARSKVMLVLWLLLPTLVTGAYFLIPMTTQIDGGLGNQMPMTYFVGMVLSSIAGTIAAVMLAVDVVSERNRNVYELFIVRPVRPETIILAKFFAVFLSVSITCIISTGLGLVIDMVRGVALPSGTGIATLKSVGSLLGVMALSSSVGLFLGVISRSILVAVVLVLYVGQNLTIVPMLPTYLGILPNLYWVALLVSAVLTGLLLFFATVLFRRAEY